MDTPLRIEGYFFPVIQVVANSEADPDGEVNDLDYSINTDVVKIEEQEKYQVSVDIKTVPKGEDSNPHYRIHLAVVGVFSVHPDWPEKEKLLSITGASILYSSAREFLITVSSRGPWGAVYLPMVSFLKVPGKEGEKKSVSPEKNVEPSKKKTRKKTEQNPPKQ